MTQELVMKKAQIGDIIQITDKIMKEIWGDYGIVVENDGFDITERYIQLISFKLLCRCYLYTYEYKIIGPMLSQEDKENIMKKDFQMMKEPKFTEERLDKNVSVGIYCQYESVNLKYIEERIKELLPKDIEAFDPRNISVQIEYQYYDEGCELLAKYEYSETDSEYHERLEEYDKQLKKYNTWFKKNEEKIIQHRKLEELKEQEKLEAEKEKLEKQVKDLERKLEKKCKTLEGKVKTNKAKTPKIKFDPNTGEPEGAWG